MSGQSKYRALAEQLRADIRGGIYREGERLSTENQLADRYGMSRQTVRQALDLLAQEGAIVRRRGSGTYVSAPGAVRERTGRVGVISTYITEYIFPSILRGIEGVLSDAGCTMELSATYNRVSDERRILQDYLQRPVDGLIVEGTKTALPNPNLDLYRHMEQRGLPVVFINGYYEALSHPVYVVMDDIAGAREAVSRLVTAGHRRIAGIFKGDDMQGHRRYAGYAQGMLAAQQDFCDRWVLWFNTETRDQLIPPDGSVLPAALSDCTAVLCYNDEIAVRLARARTRAGRELALYSFDNSAYCRLVAERIPSMIHAKEALGRLAAQKLLSRIDGADEQPALLAWRAPDSADAQEDAPLA